jgi:hypothetical protein
MIKQYLRKLKNVDVFGEPFSFYVNNERKNSTQIGGLLTLLMFSFILRWMKNNFSYSIYSLYLMHTFQTLQISKSQFYHVVDNPLILNSQNFMVAIGSDDYEIFSKSYFKVQMRYRVVTRNMTAGTRVPKFFFYKYELLYIYTTNV